MGITARLIRANPETNERYQQQQRAATFSPEAKVGC